MSVVAAVGRLRLLVPRRDVGWLMERHMLADSSRWSDMASRARSLSPFSMASRMRLWNAIMERRRSRFTSVSCLISIRTSRMESSMIKYRSLWVILAIVR